MLTDAALADEILQSPPVPAAAGASQDYTTWENEPRLRALLQLVRGDPVQSVSDAEIPPLVRGLLEGCREKPVPTNAPHRYLIFTMYGESTEQIAAAFSSLGVAFVLLRGTRRNKDKAVHDFKTGRVAVMVATSSRDCAGLHLPEVTRLVFYHHHIDKDIARQSVGRAQRVHREYSLEVIELMTEGEAKRFG